MFTEIHWIAGWSPGRLGTMARPRGGDWLEDEIHALRNAGVNAVASALTYPEMRELGLLDEPELCQKHHIDFYHFPIPDRGLPHSIQEWNKFINALNLNLTQGKSIVSHCRMGVGRASLIASSLMIRNGSEPGDALIRIERARGLKVPDSMEQKEWILNYRHTL